MLIGGVAPGVAAAEERSEKSQSSVAESVLERFTLAYSLQPGEKIRYEVTHQAKTKTRIRGAEEVSQVHTISQRHWDVLPSSTDGEMTFEHTVDSVEMTQQQGEEDEIRWDSQSGNEPPSVFSLVAEQMGKKLATVTINTHGHEIKREDHAGSKASLGMGTLTLQLPEEPVAIGQSWTVPHEVKARLENGEIKIIKIQERYTLEKVQTGVANLSLRSEPLTPMRDESVRAQVVQQLSNGEIRFDIDNGRMLSKQLDWDETVIGFQGPNSLMEYRARMTEQLVDDVQRTAKRN
ncbi:hypothetical protein Q31b_28990 [Novipirellula aureliae]|uniref:Uncharacterized protein n=1 Tax=Novipirellula aureliae TaxID=2527966 RepID=A0A5C6DXU5_9BACT|nr:hypothetical protein [Novipirellula aureliae]TWU41452.1 hypothetical protein Q31b_28990 [Novipirellula aureliae]